MNSFPALDRHPVLACVDMLESALKSVADVQPSFMPIADKREALLRLTTLAGQLEALRLRLISSAEDVAEQAACRTVADWLGPKPTGRRVPVPSASPGPWPSGAPRSVPP